MTADRLPSRGRSHPHPCSSCGDEFRCYKESCYAADTFREAFALCPACEPATVRHATCRFCKKHFMSVDSTTCEDCAKNPEPQFLPGWCPSCNAEVTWAQPHATRYDPDAGKAFEPSASGDFLLSHGLGHAVYQGLGEQEVRDRLREDESAVFYAEHRCAQERAS